VSRSTFAARIPIRITSITSSENYNHSELKRHVNRWRICWNDAFLKSDGHRAAVASRRDHEREVRNDTPRNSSRRDSLFELASACAIESREFTSRSPLARVFTEAAGTRGEEIRNKGQDESAARALALGDDEALLHHVVLHGNRKVTLVIHVFLCQAS